MLIQHAELPEVTNELSVSLRLNILYYNPAWACERSEDRTPSLWLAPKDSAPDAQFSTTDCINTHSIGNGLSLNRWYHLVYTLSEPEKQLDFYIDGKWVEFAHIQQNIKFNNGPLCIGNDRFFDGITGLIGNFRYYNWRLSAEEAKVEYLSNAINFKSIKWTSNDTTITASISLKELDALYNYILPITFSSRGNSDFANEFKEKKSRNFHEYISEPITFSSEDRMIIQHAELPEVTNELSVSLRLNILYRNSEWACIFHKGERNEDRTPGLWLTPKNSALDAQFSTTNCLSTHLIGNGLSLNRWYHLVYTLSEPEKQFDFYIDGKCVEFARIQQNIIFNNGPLCIGNDRFHNGITGLICNFRYYNWRLSGEEVKNIW
ncbi:6445_t:CDS:2 [Ambispora leptoticha]|uniref:6445_t:CDS:1 n=1 Tax=Ambispora leptoticha TaxID=144679 RepID=A0A9N9GJR8_9GLOM|nr:6445_t:CDS:2 [Ambispora leptoticha]